MKRSITPIVQSKKTEKKVVAPSNQTLDLIRGFARAYHSDKVLPVRLSGLYLN